MGSPGPEQATQSRGRKALHPTFHSEASRCGQAYLQDEDEVVGRLVPGVQIVVHIVFVVLVKLELLNDVWVLEQPKQDLL